jgi:hypothetical protein
VARCGLNPDDEWLRLLVTTRTRCPSDAGRPRVLSPIPEDTCPHCVSLSVRHCDGQAVPLAKPKPEESILESPYIGLAALAARVRYEWRGSSSTNPAFRKGSKVPARTLPKSLLPASVPLVKSSATARVCSRTRSPSEFVGRACSRSARRGSGGSPVRIEASRREVRVESRSESHSAPARLLRLEYVMSGAARAALTPPSGRAARCSRGPCQSRCCPLASRL